MEVKTYLFQIFNFCDSYFLYPLTLKTFYVEVVLPQLIVLLAHNEINMMEIRYGNNCSIICCSDAR